MVYFGIIIRFDDFVKNVPNSLVSNIDPNLLVKIKYKLEDQVNKNTKPVDEAVYDEVNISKII